MLFLLQTVTKIVSLCIGLQCSLCDLICCTGLYINLVILLPTIIWMWRSGLFVWMRSNYYVQRIRLWRVQWLESGLRLNLYSWHTFYDNTFTEQILKCFSSGLPLRVKGWGGGKSKLYRFLSHKTKHSYQHSIRWGKHISLLCSHFHWLRGRKKEGLFTEVLIKCIRSFKPVRTYYVFTPKRPNFRVNPCLSISPQTLRKDSAQVFLFFSMPPLPLPALQTACGKSAICSKSEIRHFPFYFFPLRSDGPLSIQISPGGGSCNTSFSAGQAQIPGAHSGTLPPISLLFCLFLNHLPGESSHTTDCNNFSPSLSK